MPMVLADDRLVVEGACGIEDAMKLLEFLQANESAQVDLRDCTHLHAASLQVLLGCAGHVSALPEQAFLRRWLAPMLAGNRG